MAMSASGPSPDKCKSGACRESPKCSRGMRIVSLIDQEDVIERILRHLGLWQEGVHCGSDPPGKTTLDPWLDDPFPDYDTEPVVAFSAT